MEGKGHQFIVTNRDQKIINDLLDTYKITHILRNKRPKKSSAFRSVMYLLYAIFLIFKALRFRKIDIFLGFASVPCSFLSFIYRAPSIIIDDTEHNSTNHFLYKNFCSAILTPFYFKKKMGKKQVSFKAYVEQLYLNSNYFDTIDNNHGINSLTRGSYALIRFISYSANHDSHVKNRITLSEKREIVKKLTEKGKVLISTEDDLNDSYLDQYKANMKPEDIHELIRNASVLISEGATMASEAGILGIRYYYINPLKVGNINEQCLKYPHAHQCHADQLLIKLEADYDNKACPAEIRKQIEMETIDPTKFLVWFVENYPVSFTEMKGNPDCQLRFK